MRSPRLPGHLAAGFAVGFASSLLAATAPVPPAAVAGNAPLPMAPVHVIGSRIPRVEGDGPSPVSVYDRDYLAASGALRLADFMNLLPQNYSGASTGRGSAPNDSNPEFGVRSESTAPFVNIALGSADVPLGQSGVAGAGLRGLGSGSTLVLVDGRRVPIAGQGNRSTDSRQGFVDLNTIPLGMVERVEVLGDGASALYGSDAIGGVINIVLKKNYIGAELATDYRGTFAGGARERHATFTAGFTAKDARLRGMIALDIYRRDALTAAQRDFSREQDHRAIVTGYTAAGAPVFGRDFRLNWGYPAVVQARTGTLNGVVDPTGAAANVALVPAGARTTPAPAQFTAAPQTAAMGARRANTAEFLALVPPQESRGVRASFEYAANDRVRGYGGYVYSDVRGHFDAQPPASTASATTGFGNFSTLVPALIAGQPNALNPFGQDVIVGLVHAEFGPIRQDTRTLSHGLFGGVAGTLAGHWTWDAGVSWSRQRFAQGNRTLDPAKFTAALAAPDPAQRFNPFVDARAAGPVNAAFYAAMATVNAYDGRSELTSGTFTANGPLRALPAGDLQIAFGGEYDHAVHRASTRPATGAPTDARAQRHSQAGFVELSVPVFGRPNARPLLRRLELQLAARYEHHGDAGDTTDPKAGIAWTPTQALLLRAGCATGFRAPSLTEYETTPTLGTSTLTDPRRTPASTPGVAVLRGSNLAAEPERSRNDYIGLVVTPPFARGLTLGLDYHRTRQRNVIQQLSPQTIANNERLLPDRVVRAAPSAADTVANQPGVITAVNGTLVNFGAVQNESLDVRIDYDLPWRRFGRWRAGLNGSHTLVARTELRPGLAGLDLTGDTGAPPPWRWVGALFWTGGNWNVAGFANHIGAFASNNAGNLLAPQGYPAVTTVNVRAAYTFREGLWRGRGKGAKIGAGLDNVFDRAPPFSDTVFGFNGGLYSARGRSYTFSVTLPY